MPKELLCALLISDANAVLTALEAVTPDVVPSSPVGTVERQQEQNINLLYSHVNTLIRDLGTYCNNEVMAGTDDEFCSTINYNIGEVNTSLRITFPIRSSAIQLYEAVEELSRNFFAGCEVVERGGRRRRSRRNRSRSRSHRKQTRRL